MKIKSLKLITEFGPEGVFYLSTILVCAFFIGRVSTFDNSLRAH